MAIMKFYTLEDLKATGLPMFAGTVSPRVKVGEVYLSDRVISMWDFDSSSRRDKYIYYDKAGETSIEKVVEICKRVNETSYRSEMLNRDLSNLDIFKLKERDDDKL